MAAYLMVSGHHLPWMVLGLWTFFLAALGVFMAIPMKRQMINIEQLKFPSGIAAAETLKSLHAHGLAALIQARSLGVSGLIAGLVTWFRDAGKPFSIPSSIPFPGTLMGKPMGVWTFEVEVGLVMIAAGAIMGWKIAWSMLLGGVINFGFLAPWAVEVGAIPVEKIGYRGIVSWSTWSGSAMLVTSGLLSLIFHWRTIGRAFGRGAPPSAARGRPASARHGCSSSSCPRARGASLRRTRRGARRQTDHQSQIAGKERRSGVVRD